MNLPTCLQPSRQDLMEKADLPATEVAGYFHFTFQNLIMG